MLPRLILYQSFLTNKPKYEVHLIPQKQFQPSIKLQIVNADV